MARERSSTIGSIREAMFNKCKSSNSISSNGQGSSSHLKTVSSKVTSTPYRNIKLSSKKCDGVRTATAETSEVAVNFDERCETLEMS